MKILLQTEYEKCKADAIEAAMESVTKDKESAIKFLKSAGIINDNGTLAKEYVADNIEQTSTWSEEDKENLLDVKGIIDKVWHSKDFREDTYYSAEELESLWSWLDDIWQRLEYPQDTWKPTVEQIKAIRLARSFVTDDFSDNPTLSEILIELENQLKKLRKE